MPAKMASSPSSGNHHASLLSAISFLTLFIMCLMPCGATTFSTHPEEKQFEIVDGGIVAAFADVNADKRTDIFLIDKTLKSFTIMVKHEYHDAFDASILTTAKRCYMDEEIVSLMPGDFRGDTYVDVAVISRNPNAGSGEEYNIRIVRGHGPKGGLDCSKLNMTANYSSAVEPLLLDYNGDMICDLLIENKKIRSVLLGPYTGSRFTKVEFPADEHEPILKTHSNHFVDVNGDSVADIVIETEQHFEYWHAHSDGNYGDITENGKRTASRRVPRPHRIKGHEITEHGLSIFADVDGDSVQEHLLPVSMKYSGETAAPRAAILILRVKDYYFDLFAGNFTPSNESQYLSFSEVNFKPVDPSSKGLTFPRAIRQGDVNGDGYPDLVSIMQPKDATSPSIVVLQNVAIAGDRTFAFMSKSSIEGPLVAAFMDLTENGKLDMIYSSQRKPVGTKETMVVNMGSMINTISFEAYFLKIMVASGNCPPGGCKQYGWAFNVKDVVDYGSNLPGPYISYSLQDVNGKKKRCGAAQMTSASHFSLQTPYLVFGLGEYANYIDTIKVTIPYQSGNAQLREREEEQIVPDAQIVIVPRPVDEPRKWIMKMWISITGNQIKHTGYTLLGIFCVLIVIIMALHKKEVMEDADENKRFKQNWLDRR